MPQTDLITNSATLLVDDYRVKNDLLEEPAEGMSIPIDRTGIQSIMYSFDKSQEAGRKEIFPYLNPISGARSMCDYIIIAKQSNKIFVLLVELKKGDSDGGPQLRAGKNFASFIMATYNRVFKKNINPEYRMISVHNTKVLKKGATKYKGISYNREGFASFKGNTFCIQEFLK